MAVCLAVLRRDGFISLDAGESAGTVRTAPFELTGETLFVNVDALKGELRAEILDAASQVIAQSKPLHGDLQRERVEWTEERMGRDVASLKGRTVSLRFNLRAAQFYSYWLE